MFQIMYSSPGVGAVSSTTSRSTRASRESTAHHPFVPLPTKDQAQISHARDPTLLYLHCERDGETRKIVEQICNQLEQLAQRGMNPLRIRQVRVFLPVVFSCHKLFVFSPYNVIRSNFSFSRLNSTRGRGDFGMSLACSLLLTLRLIVKMCAFCSKMKKAQLDWECLF
jgi:hypothetical protein